MQKCDKKTRKIPTVTFLSPTLKLYIVPNVSHYAKKRNIKRSHNKHTKEAMKSKRRSNESFDVGETNPEHKLEGSRFRDFRGSFVARQIQRFRLRLRRRHSFRPNRRRSPCSVCSVSALIGTIRQFFPMNCFSYSSCWDFSLVN